MISEKVRQFVIVIEVLKRKKIQILQHKISVF